MTDSLVFVLTLLGALIITVRSLCVLDHMSRKTRWWMQGVYVLECAGATTMAAQVLMGDTLSAGALMLLAGVVAANLYDSRAYPPRTLRRVRDRKAIQ